MIQDSQYEKLQKQLQAVKQTKTSADELLDAPRDRMAQKRAILDSFSVTKFNKDYLNWKQQDVQDFVETDVLAYNKKVSVMRKLNIELETALQELEAKNKQVTLPLVSFSRVTFEEFDSSLIETIGPVTEIRIDQVFSLDGVTKPQLTYESFEKLINIEYRFKIERMIKYDILRKIHREMTGVSQKWTSRNSGMDGFMNDKLAGMIREVESVRQVEREEIDLSDEEEEEPEEVEAPEEVAGEEPEEIQDQGLERDIEGEIAEIGETDERETPEIQDQTEDREGMPTEGTEEREEGIDANEDISNEGIDVTETETPDSLIDEPQTKSQPQTEDDMLVD